MTIAELGILAILAYAGSFMVLVTPYSARWWRFTAIFLSLFGIVFHGIQLHWLIDLPQGQNLSAVNLLSLLTWLAALIIFIASMRLPVRSLSLLVFPMAILAIGVSEFYNKPFIIVTEHHLNALIHILLATLVGAVFIVAGIQAMLVLMQQYCLQRKKMLGLLELLPPLQMMQKLLAWEIVLCFSGLTLLLLTSLVFFETHTISSLWFKSLLTAILWITFLLLLLGRVVFKWRSQRAAIWTAFGMALSMIIYLGSHIGLH